MSTEDIYIQRDDFAYIRVEPTEVAREIESLKLVIRIAEEKIASLREALRVYQEESEEFENGMDEINDIEMASDDLKVFLKRLISLPRKPPLA